MVLEGAASGPNPPVLTFCHVPADRVMQRAVHFSSFKSHGLSHTVFMDADLWFPSDFWAEYAKALQREPMGYWSCTVMEIREVTSNILLEQWRNVSESTLSLIHRGPRGELWKGKVGHFQCVPTGLLRYPEDRIMSVERADQTFAHEAIRLSSDQREDRRIGDLCAFHFDHPSCWQGTKEEL